MSDRILAAVMVAPHLPIDVREFAAPDLPAGSALLRTTCSEVCGTDVHLWHGRLAGVPYPIIPGHVSAGILDRVPGPLEGIDGSGSETGHFLRALSLLERHAGHVPWHAIGARRYGLGALDQALDDAARDAHRQGARRSVGGMRAHS